MRWGISILAMLLCLAVHSTILASQENFLTDAYTDVPTSSQPEGYSSLVDGGPFHVMSAITAVEFHVPGKISSEPGGLSPFPQPILHEQNGVKYWRVTGELSGYLTDDLGQHIVMGPVDPHGVSHRFESFDPDDPGIEDSVSHPRAGLSGAFFALSIPVKGFNHGLIQIMPAGDGGTFFPAASLVWNPVDPMILLKRGYGIFNFAQGGTVAANGEGTIDTNPDSGSEIFWADPPENVVSYSRYSFFDESTKVETTYPSDFEITIFDSGDFYTIPFGDPEFFVGSLHVYPEIISDTIVFAKNLVREAFASEVKWASYVGWSGSVRAAILINSNTRFGAFQVEKKVGPQAGGNAYNVFGEPSSGLRYDAFVCLAGANDSQGYLDQGGPWGGIPSDVNPEFPASAPFVWLVPELDTVVPQYAAYAYANKIWRALENQGDASSINDLMRIYSLPKSTHSPRDFHFAAFDDTRKNGLWFEYLDSPEFGHFNGKGKGSRIADIQARVFAGHEPDIFASFNLHGAFHLPRQTALWLQTFTNLRSLQENGIPLPTSRVDPRIYQDIASISTETRIPPYPTMTMDFPESIEEFFETIYTVSHQVAEDTRQFVMFPDEEPQSLFLSELAVQEYQDFADNPLQRSIEAILLPDVAAPITGPGIYVFDGYFPTSLSQQQFKARYGNRMGYVTTFAKSTFKLVSDRLWDLDLGLEEVFEKLTSPLPLTR